MLMLACFCKVFLAGLQTKNVQHNRYLLVIVTSVLMSVADLTLIKLASSSGWLVALTSAIIGNSSGMVVSMLVYNKLLSKKEP